jgi:hypothetical protein
MNIISNESRASFEYKLKPLLIRKRYYGSVSTSGVGISEAVAVKRC